MNDAHLALYARWRASSALRFHSRPRATVVVRPMSQAAYAAAIASLTLRASR
jgi:hypothetical protein